MSLEGDALWSAKAQASVSPDDFDLPRLDLSATLMPMDLLRLTLALEDSLALLNGKKRMRNEIYAARGGALTLSARVDF
jgi:hypothetical protein